MSNIMSFCKNISDDKQALMDKLPACKMKFRKQFSINGNNFEYDDLSKVYVTNTDNTIKIIPKIFEPNREDKSVDYIGVYTIGILEILYLIIHDNNSKKNFDITAQFNNSFAELSEIIFKDYTNIDKIFSIIGDCCEDNKPYNEALNLYFSMRNDFDMDSHETILKFIDHLMIIWLLDKKLYWQVWFELMEYCKLILMPLFKDALLIVSTNMVTKEHIHTLCLSEYFVQFESIKYESINHQQKAITNCRGLAIYQCISLYYRLLYHYGYDYDNTPEISHNDDNYIDLIDTSISNSIGNDDQSNALQGINISNHTEFDVLGIYNYKPQKVEIYKINGIKFLRSYYEERLLFARKYDIKELSIGKNVNVHYSNIYKLFSAVSEMWYLTDNEFTSNNTYVDKINSLTKEVEDLNTELTKCNNQIETNEQKYREEIESNTEKYMKEIDELKSIIQSKNSIIEDLTAKNKDLNEYITNIYDDTFEITDEDEIVDLDTMIEFLNDFKIVLIGGISELETKIKEYNLSNIKKIDINDISTGSFDTIKYADFCVINTKFVSHKLVYKAKSIIDNDKIINFNGTNPERLISAMYDFIIKYLS